MKNQTSHLSFRRFCHPDMNCFSNLSISAKVSEKFFSGLYLHPPPQQAKAAVRQVNKTSEVQVKPTADFDKR